MEITIKTDESLSPEKSVVIINNIEYKNIIGLQLRLAKSANGELVIQHDSGYLEAYKAEVNNEL
jgi:hypothetical protein